MGGKGSKANIEPSKEKVIGAAGEEMHTYNDGAFKRVREAAGVADDFLMDGFDFRLKTDGGKMKEGGGKGGNLMGFTDNMMFIVKELSDGDHDTLLSLTPYYIKHVTHKDGSLLCRFYAHFNYDGGNYVMVREAEGRTHTLLYPLLVVTDHDLATRRRCRCVRAGGSEARAGQRRRSHL